MNDALACLRHRLSEWARWTENWRPRTGAPKFSSFVTLMTPSLVHDGESYDKVDLWTMQILDSSINSLQPRYSKAIYAVYLGGKDDPACDFAELELIAIVQNRGVLLI